MKTIKVLTAKTIIMHSMTGKAIKRGFDIPLSVDIFFSEKEY